MLIHKATLPLIITRNSDNEVCIPEDITIGTSELNDNDSYSINEITLTVRLNGIQTNVQTNPTQKAPYC